MHWTRKSSLFQKENTDSEIWIRENKGNVEEFPLDLYLGKKTNLLKLKDDIVKSIQEKISYYQKTRRKLYSGATDQVLNCPVTNIATSQCSSIASIYGAEYMQSPDTGHVFVKNRPSKKAIHDFYLNDITYAATYTNKKSAESRLEAIAVPWRDWMKIVYKKQYKSDPIKILDVGSGAGHFVEACKRDGMISRGIELSESSQKFAKEIWKIDLDGRNFLDVYEEYEGFDVVTFWGLLEHTPNPGQILEAAHKIVSKSANGGMVIAKLPRWNSLSSATQRLNTSTIIRHIDPMGHIMLFTDASASELFYLNGFSPTAAWYYGMDVYETLMQIGNRTNNYDNFINTGVFQVELQQFIDENRFSDGLTLVGVPNL